LNTKTAPKRYRAPIEELRDDNRGIVRIKLGNMHCMTRPVDAIREIRNGIKNWDAIPRPLRRGFILLCLETIAENRGTFRHVMTGGR